MARCLGKPVRQLEIVEIGGGQQMERARYEGINNQVTAIDIDVIPCVRCGKLSANVPREWVRAIGKNCWTQAATGR